MDCAVAALVLTVVAATPGKVEYIGGTRSDVSPGIQGALDLADQQYLAFYAKKTSLRVAYTKINLIEYGQKVDRRIAEAIVLSPMFLLAKKRKHFLTLGFADDEGRQQALVFQVDKNAIRALLVSLEARTGLKVHFQDEEARKAGRG